MAYLITCAGSKQKPILFNPSSLESLSYNDKLGDLRKDLLKLNPQIQLDWNFTLPAWELYSGNRSKIYPQVSRDNWIKNGVEIKVLSALFGWINHPDLIPYYDLKMDFKIPNTSQRVYKFWEIAKVLHKCISKDDIDLLSGTYRKAIHGNSFPVSKIPVESFNDYGVQKGIWLNKQLELI